LPSRRWNGEQQNQDIGQHSRQDSAAMIQSVTGQVSELRGGTGPTRGFSRGPEMAAKWFSEDEPRGVHEVAAVFQEVGGRSASKGRARATWLL